MTSPDVLAWRKALRFYVSLRSLSLDFPSLDCCSISSSIDTGPDVWLRRDIALWLLSHPLVLEVEVVRSRITKGMTIRMREGVATPLSASALPPGRRIS